MPPPQSAGPQLGCVPLRPLSLTEILDGAFVVLRRNPRPMFGLAAIIAIIDAAATTGLQVWLYSGRATSNSLGLGYLNSAADTFVISAFLGAVLTGLLAGVVTEDVLGIRLTLRQTWARARIRIWPLLGLALATVLAQGFGLVAFVVLGAWLWGIWAVALPAFVVERTTVRGAWRRSVELVRGSFWRVWGIRALGAVMLSLLGSFIGAPFAVIALLVSHGSGATVGSGSPTLVLLLAGISSIITTTIIGPVRSAIDALLYVDLRMRREGLDLVILQQRAARSPAGVR